MIIQKNQRNVNFKGVKIGFEKLSVHHRQFLEKFWGVNTVSTSNANDIEAKRTDTKAFFLSKRN